MRQDKRQATNRGALALLAVVSTGVGCTSLLGLGGDFTVATGGSTSSSTGPGGGTGGAGGNGASSSSTAGGGATGGSGGSGGGIIETGDITGHSVVKQLDDTGMAIGHEYVDFSATSTVVLEAIFRKTDGTWVNVSGIGAPGSNSSGIFSIPATIDGPYILHFGNTWAVMENRNEVDLDTFTVANFSVPTLSTGNDPTAQYHLTGMRPWQDNDIIEFLSPSTGVYSFINDPTVFNPPIADGDTFVNSTASYEALTYGDPHRIDSSEPVHVFHLTRYGTDPYQSIADYAQVTFDVPDSNATFDITADCTNSVQHTSIERHVVIHDDAFDALASDFNPSSTLDVTTLNFSLQPVPYDKAGQIVGTADLAASDQIAPASGDIDIDFFFGNPFPAAWQLAADFRKNAKISVQASGQMASSVQITYAQCLILDGDPLLNLHNPLEPQTNPVKAVKVDGASFNGGGALASSTPTLTWTAPTGPTPAELFVQAEPVIPDGNGGSRLDQFSANAPGINLKGSATSVTLPPGFLQASTEYLFRIISSYSPQANHENAPGRIPATQCSTATISGKFKTP